MGAPKSLLFCFTGHKSAFTLTWIDPKELVAWCYRVTADNAIKLPFILMNARSHRWSSRLKLREGVTVKRAFVPSLWVLKDLSKKEHVCSELKCDWKQKKKRLVLVSCLWEYTWILLKQKELELFMKGDYGICNSCFQKKLGLPRNPWGDFFFHHILWYNQ